MFWETLWPLILGFGLAGAVQAFVSRGAMQRRLGSHRAGSVVRASGYGMVSSSCSYAASAMAKSLFAKGADYIAAMVFMFASTNLVIELGIVLIVLMGWQFAVSEFVGGIIMIVLLATLGALWLRGRVVVEARQRCRAMTPATSTSTLPPATRQHTLGPCEPAPSPDGPTAPRTPCPISPCCAARLSSVTRWQGSSRSSSRPRCGRRCLSRATGSGRASRTRSVGPFIAVISFVCSIGNVPLAAALWTGGISFGGVIAFIFADLIAFPLLLIYRRYYGTALMVRMLIVFWALMSTAGLLTELLFRAAGLVPTYRPVTVAPSHFSWNYTTYLNLVFLVLFAVLYWLYRNRERLGVAATATPATRCAECRSRRRTRRPRSSTRASATPSAQITAPMPSAPKSEGRCERAQLISPSPLTSAPILSISRSWAATSGSSCCPRPLPPPRPWAAGLRRARGRFLRFLGPRRLVDPFGSGVVRLVS